MRNETKSYPLPDEEAPAFGHGDYVNGGQPGLTKREYAAVHLGVPCGTPWLDEMIEQARRERLAGLAMVGLVWADASLNPTRFETAKDAFGLADAILARSAKGGE